MAPSSTSNAGVVAPAVPRTRLLNSLGLIAAAAILIFGAWVSLRYTFGAFAPDADIAVPVVLWDGVRHYGLGFLKTWSYTQDNWLLSLIPLTSLIFTLFGTNPKLVVAIGWLFFLACVGMTSFLVYRIAGRRAAFPVAAVLLFPNNWAIGSVGFLSYPISHDVSMAWALLALMLALRAIERASLLSVAAAGLCVFVDAMSDPWAGAAIALPLILASAVLAGLNWRVRQGWYAGLFALPQRLRSWRLGPGCSALWIFCPRVTSRSRTHPVWSTTSAGCSEQRQSCSTLYRIRVSVRLCPSLSVCSTS